MHVETALIFHASPATIPDQTRTQLATPKPHNPSARHQPTRPHHATPFQTQPPKAPHVPPNQHLLHAHARPLPPPTHRPTPTPTPTPLPPPTALLLPAIPHRLQAHRARQPPPAARPERRSRQPDGCAAGQIGRFERWDGRCVISFWSLVCYNSGGGGGVGAGGSSTRRSMGWGL